MRREILRNIALLTASGALLGLTGCNAISAKEQETPNQISSDQNEYPKTERTATFYQRIYRPEGWSTGSYIRIRLVPGDESKRLIIINGRTPEDMFRGLGAAETYCGGTSDTAIDHGYQTLTKTTKVDCPSLIPEDLPYANPT